MLSRTPKPKVRAKPCIREVEKLEPNQYRTTAVIKVERLPSLIDDHALSKPTVIELSKFLPESNSSLILSEIKIFALLFVQVIAQTEEMVKGGDRGGISANLFCQNSQVTFTLYRIVLKDVHY